MKMKCLFLIVLLLAMGAPACASSLPAMTIGKIGAAPLQRVQVPVMLATRGATLATVMMDIKFDAALVSSPEVTLGAAGAGKTLLAGMLPSGALRVTLYDLQNVPLRDGILVNLVFTVAAAATSGSVIDLAFDGKTLGAADPAGHDIPVAGASGSVTVP